MVNPAGTSWDVACFENFEWSWVPVILTCVPISFSRQAQKKSTISRTQTKLNNTDNQCFSFLKFLEIQFDPNTFLPLSPMDANPDFCNPGAPYAATGWSHQRDLNCVPNIDIAAHPGAEFLPLGCAATGEEFWYRLSLYAKKAAYWDKKGG